LSPLPVNKTFAPVNLFVNAFRYAESDGAAMTVNIPMFSRALASGTYFIYGCTISPSYTVLY